MARKLPVVALSKLIGGVHSQEAEARGDIKLSPDRCLSALNVEEKDGYLKRRPAFKTIAHGPQHYLPAGQAVVIAESGVNYDRQATFNSGTFTAGTYIYVGCDTQFDGIDIPDLEINTTNFSSHGYIKVECQDSLFGWTELGGVVDFTRGRCTDASNNVFIHTLTQPGTIAWTPPTFTWDLTTISSVSKYWIRLSIVEGDGTQKDMGAAANWLVFQPGILCFTLEPVNGILPARYRDGKSVLFFGGDRQSLRGLELGGNISAWTQTNKSPRLGFKLEDWGGALYDTHDNPTEWLYSDAMSSVSPTQRTWPFSNSTGLTTTYWLPYDGTNPPVGEPTSRLVKIDQTYTWLADETISAAGAIPHGEFRGGCIRYGITPTSVTSNSSTTKRCVMVFSSSDLNAAANELEHCFLRITHTGTPPTGITLGEEVQIISNTTTTITTYPEFDISPDTTCTFNIYRPHYKVQYGGDTIANRVCDFIYYNTQHYLQFNPDLSLWPFNFQEINSGWYHFYIGQDINWAHDRGLFWNSVYDPISAKHILTNGRGPLLEWDGKYFKNLEALTDPDSVRVQQYTTTLGAFDDVVEANQATEKFVKGALHATPPRGSYLATFASKILVADNKYVRWTVAYDTDIWPRRFEQEIRDPFSNNITGMEVVGNTVVVFTPTAIFASPPPDQAGMFNFQLESTGMGFSSGRGVTKILIGGAPALIGPTADGVRVYSPGAESPATVIDSWTQVLPEGVNIGLLSKCVGAASKFDNRYYLAVPRAGSTIIDTILVFDLVTKAWWVWRFPNGVGVTSIARDYDETGNERMLFGGSDGMVYIMAEQLYDDGSGIAPTTVAWNALSPPIEFKGSTVSPVAMMLRGDENTIAMTVTTYLNGRVVEDDSSSITFDDGSAAYGSGTYGTSTYSEEGDLVTKLNLPTGTRCTSFQYKLSGTGRFTFKGAELLATQKGQRGKQ